MTAQPIPELQALLAAVADAPALDPSPSVASTRAAADAGVLALHRYVRDHGPLHEVRDVEVAGVPCRLYVAKPADESRLHVHVHGGGWWMGSLETVDPMARELAHVSGMAVLSVGYRLAPEHPYPAAVDDLVAVLRNLDVFGAATVSVGGESAGGNLSALAAQRVKHEVPLVAQWLDIPCVDLRCPTDDSMEAYGAGYGLEMSQLDVLQGMYGADPADPLVSPALAEDLSGLAPALITTAECDPLRDQAERYAKALEAQGNDVVYRCHAGQIHASSWLTALTPENASWYDETVALLVERHSAVAVAR